MSRHNIMIVEDEWIIAFQIKSELERLGYGVNGTYASAELALENMERTKPDLVLMDIKLQGAMDGVEAARRIARDYDAPVIILTAHADDGTVGRAVAAEPYSYLLKPVDGTELLIAIRMALYKHQIDREKEALTKELKRALEQVKRLSGILPICCVCKRIRDDAGYWSRVESYIRDHSEAEFTHGYCPECQERVVAEIRSMENKRK